MLLFTNSRDVNFSFGEVKMCFVVTYCHCAVQVFRRSHKSRRLRRELDLKWKGRLPAVITNDHMAWIM